MTNIITACFGGTRFTNTRPAWLIDHGMVLQIKGVELPNTYEVDFSNSKSETATRVLGGPDGVVIPDQYFLSSAPQIFAWVYLTTGDSGFTTLQVTIPLSQRPDVSTEPPTPQETSLIEQAIAALNDGVERAETAADDAEAAATNIQQTVNDALQAAKDSGEFDGKDGKNGEDGANGVTYTPYVDAEGIISWTNDGNLPNPEPRNIRGPKGEKLTYADLTAADKADLVQGPIADAQTAAEDAVNQTGTTQVQAVADKGAEVLQSIPSDYTELSEKVDTKAPAIYNSVSGAIVSFDDGAEDMPVKALTVNVEPIQDLHGQASPYPAGGGPNKLPPLTSETKNGVTITVADDGTITINGEATTDSYFDCDFTVSWSSGDTYYFCAFNPVASTNNRLSLFVITPSGNPQVNLNTVNAVSTMVASSNATANRWRLRVPSGVTYSNFVVKPMFQVGGTAPTAYAPYSNICPISGRTSATVTRTGKNLLDPGEVQSSKGLTITKNTDGSIDVVGTPTGTWVDFVYHNVNIPAGQYIFSINSAIPCIFVLYYYLAGDPTRNFYAIPRGSTSTVVTFNGDVVRISLGLSSLDAATAYNMTISAQIELSSTASAYEPYQGNTYTIQLGDIVYGGTLDVTGGKMVVDKAMYTFSESDVWTKYATGGKTTFNGASRFPVGINKNGEGMMSNYPFVKADFITNQPDKSFCFFSSPKLSICDNSYADATASDFASSMIGQQLIYPLAQPFEITLTPTQIDTLLGTNNIWSDAGSVGVEYPADTKLYIQKINAPTDDDMTADAQIASGKYFLIGGNLYKSTAVIPAGDTIIPGTNCIKTNLAEALNALNA